MFVSAVPPREPKISSEGQPYKKQRRQIENIVAALPSGAVVRGSKWALKPPQAKRFATELTKHETLLKDALQIRTSDAVLMRLDALLRFALSDVLCVSLPSVLVLGCGVCEEASTVLSVFENPVARLDAVDMYAPAVVKARYLNKKLRMEGQAHFYCADASSLTDAEGFVPPDAGYVLTLFRHPSSKYRNEAKGMSSLSSMFLESHRLLHSEGFVVMTFYTQEEARACCECLEKEIPEVRKSYMLVYEGTALDKGVPEAFQARDVLYDSSSGEVYTSPEGWLLDGYTVVLKKAEA
jgi:hypothetical protein